MISEYRQLRDQIMSLGGLLLTEEHHPHHFGSAFSLFESATGNRFRLIWDGKEEWLRIEIQNAAEGWDGVEPIVQMKCRTWVHPVDRTQSSDRPPEFDQLSEMIPALLTRLSSTE